MVYKIDDGFEDLNSGCADEEPEEAGPGVMGHMLKTFKLVKDKVALSPRRGRSNPSSPGAVETTQQQESNFEDLQSDSPHSLESRVGENHPHEYSLQDQDYPQEHSPTTQELHGIEALDLGSTEDGGQIGDGFSATESSSSLETGMSQRGSARSHAERMHAGAGGHIGDGFDTTGESTSLEDGVSPRGSARSHAERMHAGAGGHIGDGFGTTGGSSSLEDGVSPRGSARSSGEGGVRSLLHMDLGEKIITKLPFSHANPYEVGGSIPAATPTPAPTPAPTPTTPYVQKSAPSSPSLFGRLEIVTTKLADVGRKIWSPRAASSATGDVPNTNTSVPPTDAGMPNTPKRVPPSDAGVPTNTTLPTSHEGLDTDAPDTAIGTASGATES